MHAPKGSIPSGSKTRDAGRRTGDALPAGEAPGRGSGRLDPLFVFLPILLGLLVFLIHQSHVRYIDQDELEHLNSAYFVSQGERIYVDFYENHPPLTALLLQPVMRSSEDPEVLIHRGRRIMLALAAGILAAVGYLGWRAGGRNAGAAAAAATLLLGHGFFFQKALEVRPDVPAALLWVIALGTLIQTTENPRWHWPVVSGALLCLAGLFTPKIIYAAAGAVAATVFAVAMNPPSRAAAPDATTPAAAGNSTTLAGAPDSTTLAASNSGAARARIALIALLRILLGAFLVGAAAALVMSNAGILRGFWNDVFGSSLRMRIDNPSSFRWAFLKMTGRINAATWILTLVGALALWRSRGRLTGPTHILIWSLGAGLIGLFLIQASMRQYFLTFLPQAAALAALGALALGRWIGSRLSRAAAVTALALAALLASGPAFLSMVGKEPFLRQQLPILRQVLEVTGRDDRVLDCWTGLYLTRLPAYRFFFLNSDVQRLIPRRQLEGDLLTALDDPRVKVVIRDPYFKLLPDAVQQRVDERFAPLPRFPYLWLRR